MGEALRLLIVQDSDDDALLVAQALERGGYVPDWVRAETPAEFAAALAGHHWDVVVVDHSLRWPEGPTPMELATQSGRDVPVIVVSSHLSEATAVELMHGGAHDVLNRENLARLPQSVRREVREARARAERRRAEDALRLSEERYRKLFEEAGDAIFVVETRTGRYLDANRAAERLTGRPVQDLRKMTTADVCRGVPPAQLPLAYQTPTALNRGEVDYVRPDGTVRTALLSTVDITSDVLFGIAHDITDRKRAEEALRRGEEELRSIFSAAPTGIAVVVGRVIQSANDRLYELTGYGHDELIGKDTRALYETGTEFERVGRDTVRQIAHAGKGSLETRWVRKDGTVLDVLLSWAQIDPQDPGRGVTFAVLDVTKSVRLEEDLRQSQRVESLGRLSAAVAHDFNNLLSPILGYSELLLAEMHPTDERRADVREIEMAAHRARELTRQLLAFGRKQSLHPRPLDLNAVAAGLERLLRGALREDIHLTIVRHPEPCVVMADQGQTEQVVMNLVVNAQDAMPNGGHLTVRIGTVALSDDDCTTRPGTTPGQYGVLVVSDTGSGMDPETKTRIFEPFFSTKGEKGTGLGLSTVYGIVTQHGGHVSVNSEPGRGSVFDVYFPATDVPPAPEVLPKPTLERRHGSGTILLVEDNEAVRQLAETVLRREGYTVLSAAGGIEAMALLDQHQCAHLLLTDVVMSGMDGRALHRVVAERCPGVKVLYMSGYTDDVVADRGVLLEGVPFVEKPFSVAVLARKVREILES
ncbi:MAG: PAS domain S-box protein [Vicinamibacterales bacterium]|nr:PAS domain S-box protein [Vicinamibacterales bacterium]